MIKKKVFFLLYRPGFLEKFETVDENEASDLLANEAVLPYCLIGNKI